MKKITINNKIKSYRNKKIFYQEINHEVHVFNISLAEKVCKKLP